MYELYKLFYQYLETIPKKDRYVLGQKCELLLIEILELMFSAAQSSREYKIKSLQEVSVKLNILRILTRLLKDVKCLDMKKYIALQKEIDEIGKMLGGWIKSLK